MFSLLLPLDANAKRHPLHETVPPGGFWVRVFHAVLERVLQFAPGRD